MLHRRFTAALAFVSILAAGVAVDGQNHALPPGVTRVAIIQAEASRAATPDELHLLTSSASSASPLQAMAVRALGRLERPGLVSTLLPLLDAQTPGVRAEAANALAQSAGSDPAAVRVARERLLACLATERDPEVRGAVSEALGRLPADSPDSAAATEKALVAVASRLEVTRRVETSAAGGRIVGLTLTPTRTVAVPMPALTGALRGLESFARGRARAKQSLLPDTIYMLKILALARPPARGTSDRVQSDAAGVRRLAFLCLLPSNAADIETTARAQDDPDPQVRRLAASSASASRETLAKGMKDPSWMVRYEALLRYGRRFQATDGCEPVVRAVGATTDHVSLLAIDLLGNACRPEDKAVETLLDLAAGVGGADWRRPAHAIAALAKAAPDRGRPMLARFLDAGPWQTRMYAAAAAARFGDVAALRTLAGDPNDNVREAALTGLSRTVGHEADAVYVKALAAADFQLVMSAARALAGSPDRAAAVPALLGALARLTALDSDSSRDPRVAILDRLQELGSLEQAGALEPYLADTDPRVANGAARVIAAWTGRSVAAAPRARSAQADALTEADLDRLARTTVRVTMADGGQFDVRLLAELAPLASARFASLAAQGYYNGLTFHRVIPNFLIQGGSPGANEFVGNSRYMRDEVGRVSQVRGTLGISTRGRDTGDAQFYINLVDSPRLDHEYTVFAEVTRGMDVVDGILEGAVMQKVEPVTRK
jgi:cyclophilin family peptidyl-prolyl cis-trans isomerase/HEAT repeat protein